MKNNSKQHQKTIKILILIYLLLFMIIFSENYNFNYFFNVSYNFIIPIEPIILCILLSNLIILYITFVTPDISKKNNLNKKFPGNDNKVLKLNIAKKRFPPKIRIEICKHLYRLIPEDNDLNVSQVLMSIKLTPKYQKWKTQLSHFEPYIENYIKDLIKIIIKLKGLNNSYKKDLKESFKKDDPSIRNNLIEKNIGKRFLTKDGSIDIKKYARLTVRAYKEYILQTRRELGFKRKQLRFDDTPIKATDFESIKEFEKLATYRGRTKLFWYGLIYEITYTSSESGETEKIAGFTKLTLPQRWHYYVQQALEGGREEMDYKIRDFLYVECGFSREDLKLDNGEWYWALIYAYLDKAFVIKPKEIHFKDETLRQAERDYISAHNLIVDGLNRDPGGGGGGAIDLPMLTIARYIALGFSIKGIQKNLLENHGINVGMSTIKKRIISYWGSYDEARILFMMPLLELLLRAGFRLHEINDAYDRFMLPDIEAFFGGKTYLELTDMLDEDWSKLPIAANLPKWSNQHATRIPIKILKHLLLNYAYAAYAASDDIVKDLIGSYDKPRIALTQQIKYQLGYSNWEMGRLDLIGDSYIKLLRSGTSGPDIARKFGYSVGGHDIVSRKLFNGLSTEQARDFLKNHPSITNIQEFKEIFYLEMDSYSRRQLPLSRLNEIILSSMTSDSAAIKANMLKSDFLTLVHTHYNSWSVAREINVANCIIRTFKSDFITKIYSLASQAYREAGYSYIKSHNKYSARLFSGFTSEEVRTFLRNHPWIDTIDDFNQAIMNRQL